MTSTVMFLPLSRGCGPRGPRRARRAFAAVALTAAALVSACSSNSSTSTDTSSGGALSGSITVLAAASLQGTFTALGTSFEATHPGTKVTFSFGASSTLATQITNKAPADVFASASAATMDTVVSTKLADNATTFAKNTMTLVVPPANPAQITKLADLTKPGVKLVLCAEAVPCGLTAKKVLAKANLSVTPVSLEADVKATLTKVELGEADAGIVYVTDALAAGTKVITITIPSDVNASTSYPIAVLTGSANSALAQAFVSYVLGADGTKAFSAAGFASP